MKEALPHLIGGSLTAVVVYFIYRDFSTWQGELVWLFSNIFLVLCTITFYAIHYFRPQRLSIRRWGLVTVAVSALWGVCWALPPFLFLHTDQSIYIAVLLVVTIALATSPAPAMVHYPSAYYIFITLPFTSNFIKLVSIDMEGGFVLSMLIPFMWITLLGYGWSLHGTMINSIKLRLENEQAWKEAEKANLAKSQFLAAASHDIRQPLQAVNLFLSSLKNRSRDVQDALLFERMEASVDSMSELLNSLLDVSKLDAQAVDVKPQHIALQPLCQKLLNELKEQAQEKQLDLSIYCESVTAYADPVLLERILNNFLSNALRYTQQGSVSLSVLTKQGHILIAVQDSGIGIPTSEHEAIFSEFHQLSNPERDRQKGLGLGLAIVRRLCDLQGWVLSLDSVEGLGSCFSIQVPLGDVQKTIKTSSVNPSVNLQAVYALVVDDEQSIREGLCSLLESWGAQVRAFDSTEAACEYLRDPCGDNVNLLVSDYRLRGSDNGIQGLQKMLGITGDGTASLLITGDTDPARIQEAKASGLTVLHKPIKPAQLRNIIQRKLKHLL